MKSTLSIPKILAKGIVTGFGSGLSPKAPGTCGTAAILCLSLALFYIQGSPEPEVRIALAFLTTLIGIVTIRILLPSYSENIRKDPQEIVIDEFAGFLTAMAFIEWTLISLLLGFVLFRIFDISKIGPIRALEKLPGAWGIMMDDIGAGLIAGLILFFSLNFV